MIDSPTLDALRALIKDTSSSKIYGADVNDRVVVFGCAFVIELPRAEVLVKNLKKEPYPYDPAGWREFFLRDREMEQGQAVHEEDDRFPNGAVRIQSECARWSIQTGFYDFYNDQLLRPTYHPIVGVPMVAVKDGADLVGVVAAVAPKA